MPSKISEGPLSKNCKGQKYAKFGVISDDFKVRRWISPEWMKMYSKSDKYLVYRNFSTLGEKKSSELRSTDFGDLEVKSYQVQ